MKKIIIHYPDDMEPQGILLRISEVVAMGKISIATIKGVDVPHYCWASRFADDVVVYTLRKSISTKTSTDTFRVHSSKSLECGESKL